MFYFCHIPKTSGSSIEAAVVDEYFNTIKIAQSHKVPDLENEQAVRNFLSNSDSYHFIKGHFGTLPVSYINNVKTYSIVREPFDRLISCFRFSQSPMRWRGSFENELKLFLTQNNPEFNSIGFDGRANMQVAYLTQELKWNHKEPFSMYFETPLISFEQVLLLIKKNNITLSTQDNRDYLLDVLSSDLSVKYNKNIILNKQIKVNLNPLIISPLDIHPDIIEKSKEINQLDYQLYNYIKNHEILNGRALLPEDIVI
jgi:hypothetical protein